MKESYWESMKNNAITLTKVTSRFKNSAKPAHTPAKIANKIQEIASFSLSCR